MTYRSTESSCKSCYSQPPSRLPQQIKSALRDEGCPVLEESGTVCGETDSLNVFLQFKKIYDDSLKKLEKTPDGIKTLKKLAPFQRLIDHLWEQNAMLIETVGELENEAVCRLTNLQEKLNKSCQKIEEYQEDINSLITIIHRFYQTGIIDPEGVEFKTFPSSCIYACCDNSINDYQAEIEKLYDLSESSFGLSDLYLCDDEDDEDEVSYESNKDLNKWRSLSAEDKYSGFSQFRPFCPPTVRLEQSKSDHPPPKKKCRCTQTKATKSVNWEILTCPKCEKYNQYRSCDCMLAFM